MADSLLRMNENDSVRFSQALMDIFKTQFAGQQSILNFLNGRLQSMITNPTGFSSQALSAMRSQASTNTATQFENAQKAAQARMDSTSPVMSGVNKQIIGQIKAAEAGALSNDLNQIATANEEQKQTNMWKALSGETTIAELESPKDYGTLATSAANAGTEAGSAYYQTQGPGVGSILGSVLGGGATGLLNYKAGMARNQPSVDLSGVSMDPVPGSSMGSIAATGE